MYQTKTASHYNQLLKKLPRLNLDIGELLSLQKKHDIWNKVKGLLPKRPSGLAYQRRERRSWL